MMPSYRLQRVVSLITGAARRYDSSSFAVLRRMLALRASHGFGLEEAYFAGLLDPRILPERVAEFVGRREFLDALRPFNVAAKDLVDDKAIFASYAQSHGLAIPRTLALVTPPFAADAADCRYTAKPTGCDGSVTCCHLRSWSSRRSAWEAIVSTSTSGAATTFGRAVGASRRRLCVGTFASRALTAGPWCRSA
jgi:hypothetical protein